MSSGLPSNFVLFSVLPFVAANVGYWLTALPLEFILSRVLAERRGQPKGKMREAPSVFWWSYWFRLIEYGNQKSRADAIDETRSQVPFATQLKGAVVQIAGPMALLGAGGASLLLPHLLPTATEPWPSLREFGWQLVVMELVGDFGLYWGHRIQHESEYLWEHFHSKHHSVGTPSPVSTLYIDGVDATLQATLPLLLAAVAARAHPVSFIVYVYLRIAENTLNHCGMESPLLDLVSLKFLPGRAANSHHDYHHRYSNYGSATGQAKNYGENFWIWDAAFGTAGNAVLRKGGKM
jgi:sterol desaturase/sphingolipid hydroxylase (fatty acid hydroxylase superfamily)